MTAYGHAPETAAMGLCGCAACGGGRSPGETTGEAMVAELDSAESSGVDEIDALVAGTAYKWGPIGLMGASVAVSYSFMDSVPDYYDSGEISGFAAFTSAMEDAARSALDIWASVANISFYEVSDSGDGGQIRFGSNDQTLDGSAGYAYYPSSIDIGGDVWIANDISGNLTPVAGDYYFLTYLHEIGHAIGLKHPGNYGSGDPPYLSSSLDNTDNTVMSYIDGTVSYPATVGYLDIQAAQYLYGTSTAGSLGNVTWGDDNADSFTGDSGENYFIGNGGSDVADLGDSDDGGLLGSGDDTVRAGGGADLLYGNQGTDLLSGGSGSDTLFGGQNGGSKSAGETGFLAYRDGVDTLVGNAGADLIYGNHGGDLMIGGDDSDVLYGGQDADTLSGGSGFDTLFGNLGADLLSGGGSSDIIYGGGGDDTMNGGDGLDRFVIQSGGGNDQIEDFTYFSDYLMVESGINGTSIAEDQDVIDAASQSGSDVIVDLGGGNTVTLIGYSVGDLITADITVF